MATLMNVCFLGDEKRILLGLKKERFGAGWYNGFGGKLEPGESMTAAAARELQEEAGIVYKPEDLNHVGIVTFTFEDKPERVLEVHVFTGYYDGGATESEEMRPEWFNRNEIPYDKAWPADSRWWPLLFSGKRFSGSVHYGKNFEILRYDVKES